LTTVVKFEVTDTDIKTDSMIPISPELHQVWQWMDNLHRREDRHWQHDPYTPWTSSGMTIYCKQAEEWTSRHFPLPKCDLFPHFSNVSILLSFHSTNVRYEYQYLTFSSYN
jgi:hypothetical protein